MKNSTIKRGDIYIAEMPQANGRSSRQQGKRPVVIIQNDVGNKYSPVLTVLPITSQQTKKPLPTHVTLNTDCGLNRLSTVLCEQPMTIDKSDLYNYIGHCNDNEMKSIEKALKIQLGINVENIDSRQNQYDKLERIKSLVDDIRELDEFLLEEPLKSTRFLRSRERKINQLKVLCKEIGKNSIMFYDDAYYTMKINQVYGDNSMVNMLHKLAF